ncbi:MAG: hypothetical protein ACK559_03030, partial [bacterium]
MRRSSGGLRGEGEPALVGGDGEDLAQRGQQAGPGGLGGGQRVDELTEGAARVEGLHQGVFE